MSCPPPKFKSLYERGSDTRGRFYTRCFAGRVLRWASVETVATVQKNVLDSQMWSYFACETKNGVTGDSEERKKQSAVRRSRLRPCGNTDRCTILTHTLCEGQHVKLPRCTAAPVPVCVPLHPRESARRRMRDQRSDTRYFLFA